MKGGIPITIALIIVLALIISTIFYTTSRTTYVRENFYSFALNEWIIINHDLTRVSLLALVRGSQNASQVFSDVFNNTYYEVYGNYTASTQNYDRAIRWASGNATLVLDKILDKILGNWAEIKRRDGYIVSIINSTGYYGVVTGLNGSWAYGRGYAGVHIEIEMISPHGEYRLFNRTIEAVYIARFLHAHTYSDPGIYIPIKFTAYISIDGVKYYYLIPKDKIYLRIKSLTFQYLNLQDLIGDTVVARPEAVFYHGAGESYTLLLIRHNGPDDFVTRILWYTYEDDQLSTGYVRRGYEYKPGWGCEMSQCKVGYHLWASITSVEIDQIRVFTGLKMYFKIGFCWYGDICDGWCVGWVLVGDPDSWAGF